MLSLPHLATYEYGAPVRYRKNVKFLAVNGYDGEPEAASKFLEKDKVYLASRISISSSYSTVELESFPGKWFNTVMFDNVDIP